MLVAIAILRDFVFHDWAWPDQRHISSDHVDQLRKLIDGAFADELPKRGDAGVVGQLLRFSPFTPGFWICCQKVLELRTGIGDHGPQLVAIERPSILALAGLFENRRSTILEPDEDCDGEDQGASEQESTRRGDNVKKTLGREIGPQMFWGMPQRSIRSHLHFA